MCCFIGVTWRYAQSAETETVPGTSESGWEFLETTLCSRCLAQQGLAGREAKAVDVTVRFSHIIVSGGVAEL